jgi:hypothetical protein
MYAPLRDLGPWFWQGDAISCGVIKAGKSDWRSLGVTGHLRAAHQRQGFVSIFRDADSRIGTVL